MPRLAYAIRSLRREPTLVAGVVLTFALAIGANAAMFGLVTRLMLSAPPGVANAERIGRVTLHVRAEDGEQYTASTTSYPLFRSLQQARDVFAFVAAVNPTTMIMGHAADATEVRAIAASGEYFSVLGARPAFGRMFGPGDDELPAGNTVVVLSYSYWKRRFAGDLAVIGRSIELDGTTFTIVGVTAPNFSGDGVSAVDLFVPLSAAFRNRGENWWSDARINLVSVIARIRDDVSPAGAAGAATVRARSLYEARGDVRLTSIELESLLPSAVRNSQAARIARWLMGVSLVVLVIATANVGTLLLLRAVRKRRDVAVRMALGARRSDLAAQLTLESLLLSIGGGIAGLFLSHRLSELARVTLLPDLAPSDSLADPRVLIVTAILSVGAGALAGLAPLFLVSPSRLTADLQGAGTLGAVNRSRTQRILVGTQVALCTVLLIGAGLFVQSLQRVESQDLGFSTARLLYVTLDFREQLPPARQREVYLETVRRLERAGGITGATVVEALPFGPHHIPPISVPGMAEPPKAGDQLPLLYGATPAYLKLLGVSLVQGRLFNAGDVAGSPLVVLVNETFAREVWPGQSALGKCIRAGFDPALEPAPLAPATLPCREVVGVVRDSRARSLRPVGREATLMQYYVPFEQIPAPPFGEAANVSGMIVGVQGDPERMTPVVQRLVQGTISTPVYARVQPYQDLLDPQLRPWRLGATLFVVFGALALGIASVGLFGVVSYLVTQRTREIGLRLALGGTGARIGRSVILGAIQMVAIGVVGGFAIAAIGGSTVSSMLFETSPYDATVLLCVGATLVLVTAAAAALPAWRAARVSPMTALRVD